MDLVWLDFYYNFITGNVKRIETRVDFNWTFKIKFSLHILHIKPRYQIFDETTDSNFPSSPWDIESINMSKKDKHFYEKFESIFVLMVKDIV